MEFSRRGSKHPYVTETIDPAVARPYRRPSFACQHYPAHSAVLQKVGALAHRSEVQVRDAFDLYVLWLGGHLSAKAISSIPQRELQRALDNLSVLGYADYEGQVLDYLEGDQLERFAPERVWNEICETLLRILTSIK